MTAISIIIAILVFGIIVLVHEWGHFIVARRVGVIVQEFAIGMGPKLIGHTSKKGTLYSLRLLPIGGFLFVKISTGKNGHRGSGPFDEFCLGFCDSSLFLWNLWIYHDLCQ